MEIWILKILPSIKKKIAHTWDTHSVSWRHSSRTVCEGFSIPFFTSFTYNILKIYTNVLKKKKQQKEKKKKLSVIFKN